MLVVGLILSILVLIFFCWLLFTLAVYALPCFMGLATAFWLYHHGAGIVICGLSAIFVGLATLLLGRAAFANCRTPTMRWAIILLFAMPAGVAGFYAGLGLGHDASLSPYWSVAVGATAAIMVGVTAIARLATLPVASHLADREAIQALRAEVH